MLIGCATAASLFPFIGTIVYTIVRPPEYLEDVRERELEIKAAEARLQVLEHRTCSNCGSATEPSFLRCPSCSRKLKEPCWSCGKPLDRRWRICPYCEAAALPVPPTSERAAVPRRAERQVASGEPVGERGAAQRQAERQIGSEQQVGERASARRQTGRQVTP
jgi:hypothetical protein